MSTTDYGSEVGMSTASKTVPMSYVIALLAVILAGGYLGFSSALKERGVEKAAPAATVANK